MSMSPRLLRPRDTAFTPRSISGLALWLDASSTDSLFTTDAGAVTAVSSPLDIATPALWLDASDAASITESGGLVSQWSDKSGNNRHATASSTARPTTGTRTVGGRNALDFNGTANSMATGGSAFPTAATHTVFLVYQLDSASQSRTSVLLTAATIGDQEIRVAGFGSTAVQYVFNNNLGTTMASTAIGLGPIVFSAREATASMRSAGAGVVSTTSGSAFAWSSGSMLIGSRTAGNYVDGLLCEVIIYPTTLTDSQTASVEAYLAAKWGISGVHAPATASSDPVGYWGDKSGNGRHLTQSTANLRGLVFTASGKTRVDIPATLKAGFSSATPTTSSTGTVIQAARFAGNPNWLTLLRGDGSAFFDAASSGSGTSPALTAGTPSFFVQGSPVASTRGTLYSGLNDVNAVFSATNIDFSTWSSGWSYYNFGSSFQFIGEVGEVLVYNRSLTTTERQRAERYLAAKWGITLAPQVSNADAQDWINRVYANGGSVTSSTAAAVNTLCDSLDASGVRPLMYRMGIFAGTGLNAALVPLYRGPSLGGTQYGNATDTNVGPFVSGDYAETGASGGLRNNSGGKLLRTGLTPANLDTVATGHMAVYHGAYTSIGAFAPVLSVQDGSFNRYRMAWLSQGNMGLNWGGSTALPDSSAAITGGGLYSVIRRSSTDLQSFVNTTSVNSESASTTPATNTQDWAVFGSNNSGTNAASTATHLLKAYSIGKTLSSAELSAYYTAMQAFQTAMGRNV